MTKWTKMITKWDRFWLLQSGTTSITKWDGLHYYKVRQFYYNVGRVLQSGSEQHVPTFNNMFFGSNFNLNY